MIAKIVRARAVPLYIRAFMFNYTRFIGHALVVALLYSKIMAETYQLPTLEYWISLALFTNVSNAAKLRCDASSGKIEAVLLDPSLVSTYHQILICLPELFYMYKTFRGSIVIPRALCM